LNRNSIALTVAEAPQSYDKSAKDQPRQRLMTSETSSHRHKRALTCNMGVVASKNAYFVGQYVNFFFVFIHIPASFVHL